MQVLLKFVCYLSVLSSVFGGDVCGLYPEGQESLVTCPPSQVITGISLATFGTFSGSCASGLVPLPACPTSVVAQVGRLCTGYGACNISCSCPSPSPSPSPTPPPPSSPPCGSSPENAVLDLGCPSGTTISAVSFASFGTPTGSCAAGWAKGACNAANSTTAVEGLCLGKASCSVPSSTGFFGDPCLNTVKQLAASVTCTKAGGISAASGPPPCACASNTPSLVGGGAVSLMLAFPGLPCAGVPKQLGLIATCGPAGQQPAPQPAPPAPAPTNPLLEYLPPPVLGLDNLLPHFSWTPPASAARLPAPAVQSAARIVVLAHPSGTPIWDSGVVNTSAPLLAPSTPLPLVSDQGYQWTVTTADGAGSWSPPSQPALFYTGLLTPSAWGGAQWIGAWRPGTLLRKTFTVSSAAKAGGPAPVSSVSLFVSACQYYLLFLDGVRVGARELDVVWTRFPTFRSYSTYQLDPSLLPPGQHTLGLSLGQGFCGQAGGSAGNHTTQALLYLALHTATPGGGLLQPPLVSDTSWDASSGPTIADSTYFGEQYNASLEQPGWATNGFVPPPGAPAWTPAVIANDPPTPPIMASQLMPPIQRMAQLPPLSITPVVAAAGPPRWSFDFGVNLGGRVLLHLPPGTPPGVNVTLKHAEALSHPPYAPYDGSVWMGSLFWAWPVDSYITGGVGGEVVHEPAFTDHGFRYVEYSADPPLPQPPTAATLTALVMRTAARPQADLALGSPLLQLIANSSWWSESAALKGIPQGAAARGERTAWTGDAAFASESELFFWDTGAFFTQFLAQLQELQCGDGTVGDCIPESDPHRTGWPDPPSTCSNVEHDPSWGTVYPTIAWGVWKYYGAVNVARQHYPNLLRYMRMLESRVNTTGLANIFCLYGDYNPARQGTSCHVTAAATYLHDLMHMAEVAGALGEVADAAAFSTTLARRRQEFHAAFWSASGGLYGGGTQTAQAVALWTGVAAGAGGGVAGNVSSWLASSMVTHGLDFGFIGVRYTYEALAQSGHIEAALRALLQTAYPSYGAELFDLYEPATSLWETWDASTHNQWLDESSRNHHYQASIHTFLRKCVAGLDMPTGAAAWTSVLVKPYAALPLPPDLALALPSARVTLRAYAGVLEVSWARLGGGTGPGVGLNVTLPSGSGGLVSVPMSFGQATGVSEGGRSVWAKGAFVPGVEGVLGAVQEGEFIAFQVTAGAFTFVTAQGGPFFG